MENKNEILEKKSFASKLYKACYEKYGKERLKKYFSFFNNLSSFNWDINTCGHNR